jgi:hypothetical protein
MIQRVDVFQDWYGLYISIGLSQHEQDLILLSYMPVTRKAMRSVGIVYNTYIYIQVL